MTFSINCSQDEIDKDLFVAVNILHGGKSYHRDFIAIAQITTEVSIHINRVINSVYEQFDLKVFEIFYRDAENLNPTIFFIGYNKMSRAYFSI